MQISACHPGAVNATAAPSAMQRRYGAAYRWVVALSGVYVAAVLLLLAAAPTQEIALQPTSITSNGGHAYVVAVPHRAFPYEVHSDDINDGLRSRLRLYEDGVQLGSAHTAHVSIRDHGHGTFSHWSGSVGVIPCGEGRRAAVRCQGDVKPLRKRYGRFGKMT